MNKSLFNSLHHVAIIATDYDKTMDFYVRKLGLPVINKVFRPKNNDWKIDLALLDAELEIFVKPNAPKRMTNPESLGLRHLAFRVDDVLEVVNYLKKQGIKTEKVRLDPITNKKMTFFRDPDDMPIEIHE